MMIESKSVSTKRKECYLQIAKLVPVAIPVAMLSGETDAAIYTNTTLNTKIDSNTQLTKTPVTGGGRAWVH